MPRFQRPCLTCGGLSFESYCPTHLAERNKKKEQARQARTPNYRERKASLYNYAYRQEAKRIKAEATHCHICQQPFIEGDKIEADHLFPGQQDSPLLPAHRLCNQRRGNKSLGSL